MSRFEGKTIVITGASRGIGAALAKRFAREGGAVVVLANEPACSDVAADIVKAGGKAVAQIADVTRKSDVVALYDAAERIFGGLDMKDVHALPGTTFSSVIERGRQDPAKSAGLTLHELETYFAIEIVEGYHQRIHRGLQRAPIAVWREFIGETPLRMPKDRMAFWVSFLPEARRKLRPDGVHMFGSLKYWHGALAADLGRSGREVVVRYDPRDISRVFVDRRNTLSAKSTAPNAVKRASRSCSSGRA
jgi:hypothetical protein